MAFLQLELIKSNWRCWFTSWSLRAGTAMNSRILRLTMNSQNFSGLRKTASSRKLVADDEVDIQIGLFTVPAAELAAVYANPSL
jgi:hypothetical protein